MTGKLWTYGRKNWRAILSLLFFSLCFTWLAIPFLLDQSSGKAALYLTISPNFILGATFLYLSLLFFAYKPAFNFWNRYKNNFRLREIPFTYMDGIFLFVIFSVMSTIIFKAQILGDISISSEVSLWLNSWFMFFIVWCGVIIYRGTSFKGYHPTTRPDIPTSDYFPDEPIVHEDEDLLDRKQFIEGLYNQITKYPLSDSFVFGLYGSWGEGKTSALNLLKNKLYEDPSVIVFEYDPWYFSSPDKLIQGFYDGLYSSLNKLYFLPNIKKTLTRYQKLLTSGLKLSGINMELGWGDETLAELKGRIEYWISITEKKVVILMDDIDRLQEKNEILEIFKLVKLSGKFKNTIFVLSFDPNIIRSYLKQEISTDPAFLDKIIQAPIHLPAIDQASIDRFLLYSYPDQAYNSAIDRLFQSLQIDPDKINVFDNEFPSLYETQIRKLFPTLRKAKRYLHGLYSTLPSVKDEVNLQDFLILEIIRVFYSGLYDDIWENQWHYLPRSWSLGIDIPTENVKEHIDKILEPYNEKAVLLELLKAIFVQVKNAFGKWGKIAYDPAYQRNKRITDPDVFPRYFMLKVPPGQLPDKMVESLIDTWNNSEPTNLESRVKEDLLRFQQEKKLVELFGKLSLFLDRIEPDTANPIIYSLFKNITLFSKEGRTRLGGSEYDGALFLMLRLINKKVKAGEIQPLLTQIVKETPSFEHAVDTVLSCGPDRGAGLFHIYDNIGIDELQKVLSERLTQHFVDGKRDIFAEEPDSHIVILYQWGTINQEERQKVNDYVFSLIDSKPKYLGKIINGYGLSPGISSSRTFRYDDLAKLYDEERLYKYVKRHDSNAYSDEDEKIAIDLFLEVYMKRHQSQSD